MASLEASSLFSIEGMVFVITGGGTGIGAMFANALDVNGASKVYILGRRMEKLQEVAAAAKNKSIVPIQCDITSNDSLAAAATQVEKEAGYLNVLIANSGATGPNLYGLPKDRRPTVDEIHKYLWNTPRDHFNEAFEVNATACFYTLIAFLKLLSKGNESEAGKSLGVKSQFIVTGSIGAFARRPGMGFAYAGAKMAIIHIVKQLTTMLADWRLDIRANVFCPGVYPSDMSKGLMGSNDMSNEGSISPEMIPATRAGTAEDAGGALLFMVSRAGAYTNGNIIMSDGGRHAIVPGTF
ncbi:NAD(P)-binding protein [Trematosphaeria pertusa]|uniref:NAD(P)-binding protein n=1 Tax=Trematosphaeria pertusa TaxID=390896 RepID=A0A6A6IQB7_9PLEO|nr:NAD(P)-binding protein [Trematosphaeria pertusa]KAF2251962.1 NAD(P)-binding protein [Trematosphaeria pertusa]